MENEENFKLTRHEITSVCQALHDQILKIVYIAVMDIYADFRTVVSVEESAAYLESLVLVQARLLNSVKSRYREDSPGLEPMTVSEEMMDVIQQILTANNWTQVDVHERNYEECTVCDQLAVVPVT